MIRPVVARIVLVALLPSMGGAVGAARADGFAPPAVSAASRPAIRRYTGHPYGMYPRRTRFPRREYGFARGYGPAPVETGLVYGWLPRNLNLPIYNAPSDGPAPTL